ncbi:hypothetical protein, partial [Seinonella peptonophila]|uniref:hypothetical protein n=1 Tax=Seinonella peptonophila TaxID=112248 RepID=UPI001C3193CA
MQQQRIRRRNIIIAEFAQMHPSVPLKRRNSLRRSYIPLNKALSFETKSIYQDHLYLLASFNPFSKA